MIVDRLGNRAAGAWLARASLEREADRVAAQVSEGAAGARPITSPVSAPEPIVQRKCARCEEEEEEAMMKRDPGASPSHSGSLAPNGGGAPLPDAVRGTMEPAFGRSFEDVRVHNDAGADARARSAGARAYTLGNDLVFAGGQLDLGSSRGLELIAHELAHVVQQSGGDASLGLSAAQRGDTQRQPDDEDEGDDLYASLEPEGLYEAQRFIERMLADSVPGSEGEGIWLDEQQRLFDALNARGLPLADPMIEPEVVVPPDAYEGVEAYFAVESLPYVETAEDRKSPLTVIAGEYELHPNVRKTQGRIEILYYVAYSTTRHQSEWVVGPDSLDSFVANAGDKAIEGQFLPVNPPEWQRDSWRYQREVMRGNFGSALKHLGRSWKHAPKDPGWLLSALTATTGGLAAGMEPAPVAEAPPMSTYEPWTPRVISGEGGAFCPAPRAPISFSGGGGGGGGVATAAAPSLDLAASEAPLMSPAPQLGSVPMGVPAPKALPEGSPFVSGAAWAGAIGAAMTSAQQWPGLVAAGEPAVAVAEPAEESTCGWLLVPHKGGDVMHNNCADLIPPNVFPGYDFMVNGKSFDAYSQGGVLWEIKTNCLADYGDWAADRTIERHIRDAQIERYLANRCGYQFVFAVADPQEYEILVAAGLDVLVDLRLVEECLTSEACMERRQERRNKRRAARGRGP